MPIHTTVIYPNEDDVKFDMNYYLSTHMPLVQTNFGKHGLKKWEIVHYQPGPDGAKPKFLVGATLVWDTPEQMSAALSSPDDAGPVMADIKNFTNVTPIIMAGPVVGNS